MVFNPGDDPAQPEAAYLLFTPSGAFRAGQAFPYTVEDVAPPRVVNGFELDEPNPTHTPRRASARVRLRADQLRERP